MPNLKRKRSTGAGAPSSKGKNGTSPSGAPACHSIKNYFVKRPIPDSDEVQEVKSENGVIVIDNEEILSVSVVSIGSDENSIEVIEEEVQEVFPTPPNSEETPKRSTRSLKSKARPLPVDVTKDSPLTTNTTPSAQDSSTSTPSSTGNCGNRRKSARLAEKSRSIKSYFISDKSPTSDEDSSASEIISPFLKKKKSQKKLVKTEKPNHVPKIDENTRAFLYSGLPEAIIQKQKLAEKKQEYEKWLEEVELFPKYSYLSDAAELFKKSSQYLSPVWIKPYTLKDVNVPVVPDALVSPGETQGAPAENCFTEFTLVDYDGNSHESVSSCCQNLPSPSFKFKRLISMSESNINFRNAIPWVEKYKPIDVPDSLAVNSDSSEKFSSWLQSWKCDINDNDGLLRKSLANEKKKRRKRRSSESDFFASDSEDEYSNAENGRSFAGLKKKSVVLYGPSGSGKSAMVYVVAKSLGFNVVEINFSSSRTGKEVMEKVEEATLSQRLQLSEDLLGSDTEAQEEQSDSDSQDSSSSKASTPPEISPCCLLLFEDINLDDAEDLGFYRAVSQLIESSCRPIVMTISTEEMARPSKTLPQIQSRISITAKSSALSPMTLRSISKIGSNAISGRLRSQRALNIKSVYASHVPPSEEDEEEHPEIDAKIDKADPLWIYFPLPSKECIVTKALIPIIKAELEAVDEDYKLEDDSNAQDFSYLTRLLSSLVEHCNCDIRASINQLQFYWSPNWICNFQNLHRNLVGVSCEQDSNQEKEKVKTEFCTII